MQPLVPNDFGGTIGTTQAQLLPEVSLTMRRSVWTLTNISTGGQTIFIGFGKNAVSGKGIALLPNSTWFEAEGGGFFPTNWDIHIVSDIAGAVYSGHERQMEGRPRGW